MSYIQDGGYDVISRSKVLPSGECIRSIHPAFSAAFSAA